MIFVDPLPSPPLLADPTPPVAMGERWLLSFNSVSCVVLKPQPPGDLTELRSMCSERRDILLNYAFFFFNLLTRQLFGVRPFVPCTSLHISGSIDACGTM